MVTLNVDYETLKKYRDVFGSRALVFYNEADAASFRSFDVAIVPVNYPACFKFSAGSKPETFENDFRVAIKVERIS